MFTRYRHVFVKAVLFIFFVSVMLYVTYPPLKTIVNTEANDSFLLFSYEDLDIQLCKGTIDFAKRSPIQSFNKLHCPENEEFVSIVNGGRIGNQMWAYASVLAVAEQTGLKPYVPSCIRSHLEDIFEGLTVSSFQDIIHCPVKSNNIVTSIKEWKINPRTIILTRYLGFPKQILPWIPNIWQEFTLKKDLKDSAQETLRRITKNLPVKKYTFVGVHVRRTDYAPFLKRKYDLDLVGPQFFLNAMAYFKQKYSDSLFIFVSDDTKWCSEQFGQLQNVFVVTDSSNKKNGQMLDLAIMAACNHTIYDYGTFGEWGAILAGGEAMCYDMIQNSKEGSLQYNSSWHLMS